MSACSLDAHTIVVFGGVKGDGTPADGKVYLFDTDRSKWSLLPKTQSGTPPPAAPIIGRGLKPLRWRRSRRVATTEHGGKTLLLAFCKGRACLDNQASKFLAPHELRAVPCGRFRIEGRDRPLAKVMRGNK